MNQTLTEEEKLTASFDESWTTTWEDVVDPFAEDGVVMPKV
jgi:hypothetical protein